MEHTIEDSSLVKNAMRGDVEAFNKLVVLHKPKLKNIVRKMVGHPEDTEDIVQEALIKANQAIKTFKGDSQFSTWLCSIGVNTALDFLRKQKQWRARAQVIYGNQCSRDESLGVEVYGVINQVEFEYDVYEHIAYCWSCVARSLEAEENSALMLREFLDLKNRESAKKMGVSESVFRHHLASARQKMRDRFEDLCALVSKKGVCYQCSGLRDGCASEKQGVPVPDGLVFEERIRIVDHANLDSGKSQAMHDLFYRRTQEIEDNQIGNENETSLCYEPDCQK